MTDVRGSKSSRLTGYTNEPADALRRTSTQHITDARDLADCIPVSNRLCFQRNVVDVVISCILFCH